jgi:hypothetical protein
MKTTYFERFAGFFAILAGIAAFLYTLTFFVLARNNEQAGMVVGGILLMLTGLFMTPALVGIYARLRETDAAFALWALVISFFGFVGAIIHGGYDLAVAISPTGATPASNMSVTASSQMDPRGLLTFGFVGLSVLFIAWLVEKGGRFPRLMGYWGYALGVLSIWAYLARLIVVDPGNLLLAIPTLLAGFIFGPVWFIWLGVDLQRGIVDERVAATTHKADLYCCSV